MENYPAVNATPIAFKAETRQLLDILIHSLYTEREIFLRELISNASDALTRIDFEILTNRQVRDPQSELAIHITTNPTERTLTIRDTGVGMTAEEMIENLGTIAHSGARDFIKATREISQAEPPMRNVSDLIGQFGVGFYSAFMVAEWIQVTSLSYQSEAQAATWRCTGSDTYTIQPAEKTERGTEIVVKLKEDAAEFAQEYRLRQVIRRHSDFIPFPIYLGIKKEQVNQRIAIWRQNPREVDKKAYTDFYQQLTLEMEPPITYAHMIVDAPAQLYAILYIPAKPERSLTAARREEGLKLYARKVLIQEYNRDLLPEFLSFVEGVVDSEDLPLNVSRESVQANKVMIQLKKLVTNKVLDTLKKLAEEDKEGYNEFWEGYNRYLKQGVAIEPNDPEILCPLLRFRTSTQPEQWSSLDEYISRMKPNQKEIYYILGEDSHSILYSPHLDLVRRYDYEVLLLTDPFDAFMVVRMHQYKNLPLANVANARLEPVKETVESATDQPTTDQTEQDSGPGAKPEADFSPLLTRFKQQLGGKVQDVRMTDRLTESPARLVDAEGAITQEMQRVYKLLNRAYEIPIKVLELNPRHPIISRLNSLAADSPLGALIMEQILEDALLIEGLHPEPASMVNRIQQIIQAALE